MGVEIERKFLLKNTNWKSHADQGHVIKQGYLNLDKERTVRIRVINGKGLLTIKGKSVNMSRLEFEYEIPIDDANQLLKLCVKSIIDKTRYLVKHDQNVWEIDIFEGDNKGLEVAEIELKSADQKINIPDWVGEEVSADARYFNSSLIEHPFRDWV